jgi:hypothetical protein
MFKINSKIKILWVLPVAMFVVVMLVFSKNTPMWMDEYIFYRLSSGLPNYSTSSDWLFVDRPSTINPMDTWNDKTDLPFDRDYSLKWIYDNKVYSHTPLAPILVYPTVKVLNCLADMNVISHIEDEAGYPKLYDENGETIVPSPYMEAENMTIVLRLIPISLFVVSMWLIFKLLYKRVGKCAYTFAIPIVIMIQILSGVLMFYWDVFMIFFFVLTLYLMDKKSKWAYVTACFMLNTKMFIGLLFLLPLIVKNWRMIFCGLSLVPFYLVIAISNGDILSPILHYISGQGGIIHSYVYHLYDLKGYGLLFISLGIPFFVAMCLPILWKFKKYPEYVVLFVVSNVYAWGSGLGMAHISCLIYVGAIIFPLVVYEYNLIDKVVKFFKKIEGSQKIEVK